MSNLMATPNSQKDFKNHGLYKRNAYIDTQTVHLVFKKLDFSRLGKVRWIY